MFNFTNINETTDPYRFPTLMLGFQATFGICGIVSNFSALIYLVFNFKVTKSIFLAILLDSINALIGFITVEAFTFSLIVTPEVSYNETNCTGLLLALMLPIQMGSFFVLSLSILRWNMVTTNCNAEINEKRNKKMMLAGLFLAFIYLLSGVIAVRIKQDKPFAALQKICMYGLDETKIQPNLVLDVPMFFINFCPLLLDFRTLWYIKTKTQVSPQQKARDQQSDPQLPVSNQAPEPNHVEQGPSEPVQNCDQTSENNQAIQEPHEPLQAEQGTSVVIQNPEHERQSEEAMKSLNNSAQQRIPKKDPLDIPIRATIVSVLTCLFLPAFVVIAKMLDLEDETKIRFIPFLGMLTNIVRVPMIIGFTVRKNERNAAISKAEEKARKQQAEIKFAMEERAKRLKRNQES